MNYVTDMGIYVGKGIATKPVDGTISSTIVANGLVDFALVVHITVFPFIENMIEPVGSFR